MNIARTCTMKRSLELTGILPLWFVCELQIKQIMHGRLYKKSRDDITGALQNGVFLAQLRESMRHCLASTGALDNSS